MATTDVSICAMAMTLEAFLAQIKQLLFAGSPTDGRLSFPYGNA